MKLEYEVFCESGFCYYNIPPLEVDSKDEAEGICDEQTCGMCGGSLSAREVKVVEEEE